MLNSIKSLLYLFEHQLIHQRDSKSSFFWSGDKVKEGYEFKSRQLQFNIIIIRVSKCNLIILG